LVQLASYKQRMAEREIAIQNAAKKQMLELEARFGGLEQKLESAAAELAQVKCQSTEHEAKLKKQIAKVLMLHYSLQLDR
jgi:predicted  nucleic acid-binding Zn-ribbon protein